MSVFQGVLRVCVLLGSCAGSLALAGGADGLQRVKVDLVAPPQVHAHEQVVSGPPKVVQFRLTIEEKKMVIDDQGTTLQAMTFNGSMPGPTLVAHEGDYIEVTLVNPATNSMPHNIDLHAATGALGGAGLTQVVPGQEVVLRFKADRSGTFVYHCAPAGMVPWHVVSGMNGALMVLPRDGLRDPQGKPLHYDRVYTIGESDLYIPKDKDGRYKDYPDLASSYQDTRAVMRTLTPSHVVFNGRVGALTGANALTSKVGESVLFIHSQANRDSRPHLIGGHGDWVWSTGKFANPPQRNMETWFIPGGSAVAALYTFKQPGTYVYLSHNLIEAMELGALAQIKVQGQWDDDLMTQVKAPGPIVEDKK